MRTRQATLLARTACAAVLALMLVSGCRTLPVARPVDWPAEKLARQQLSSWQMQGRAAVATANDGWSAGISWMQNGSTSELSLSGALGVGGVRVSSDGDSFAIDTSKGEHIAPPEAEAALERTIGVDLPVRNLRFWLLGVPAPATPATEMQGKDGQLERLEQDGWVVTYDRYAEREGRTLPGRVQLERPPVRVRVIVKNWDLST
jgi:outer membrane lipoprotein LolB